MMLGFILADQEIEMLLKTVEECGMESRWRSQISPVDKAAKVRIPGLDLASKNSNERTLDCWIQGSEGKIHVYLVRREGGSRLHEFLASVSLDINASKELVNTAQKFETLVKERFRPPV